MLPCPFKALSDVLISIAAWRQNTVDLVTDSELSLREFIRNDENMPINMLLVYSLYMYSYKTAVHVMHYIYSSVFWSRLLIVACLSWASYCFHTLQRHNTDNSKQIFPGNELRGYSPNSYIHVSVSDLYTVFPWLVCLFCCRKICGPNVRIYRSVTDTCENWDWDRAILFLGIHKSKFLCSAVTFLLCKSASMGDIIVEK